MQKENKWSLNPNDFLVFQFCLRLSHSFQGNIHRKGKVVHALSQGLSLCSWASCPNPASLLLLLLGRAGGGFVSLWCGMRGASSRSCMKMPLLWPLEQAFPAPWHSSPQFSVMPPWDSGERQVTFEFLRPSQGLKTENVWGKGLCWWCLLVAKDLEMIYDLKTGDIR